MFLNSVRGSTHSRILRVQLLTRQLLTSTGRQHLFPLPVEEPSTTLELVKEDNATGVKCNHFGADLLDTPR